jgi:nucleoside-diphosphate-sugar epimerase
VLRGPLKGSGIRSHSGPTWFGVPATRTLSRGSSRARGTGRLRIVGEGRNRVDMVHVENAADAHIAAEAALRAADSPAGGKAYFITNGEPVVLWDWINGLLTGLGEPPVTRRISLAGASVIGAACEAAWSILRFRGEPPMTRFVAAELAKDHWFDGSAAARDLGYAPRVSMAEARRS